MKERYFEWANTEEFISIRGMSTGRKFQVRKHTYGVLVPDDNHPLSAVSVSNNSLSIDFWIGCHWQCCYCHVQGTHKDLAEDGRMPRRPIRRHQFSIDEILDELVKHPFFLSNETIISIGTASTEPFASGEVAESTFEIMNAFIARGLKNPFWIITKAGVPKGKKQDIAYVVKAVNGLMISLCWADNPNTIEPIANNRFNNCEEAREAGATIAWYMRPIVTEWSGNYQRIEMMMLWVKQNYGDIIEMIVPGGLRWTEGVENGLVEIHKQPMPDIPKNDNVKSLAQELWEFILKLSREHFPGIPIYRNSSCALTYMLGLPSLTSVQVKTRESCESSICPATQRAICTCSPIYSWTIDKIQQLLDQFGIPAKAIYFDPFEGLITEPKISTFAYAIQQTLLKYLSTGGRSHAHHG